MKNIDDIDPDELFPEINKNCISFVGCNECDDCYDCKACYSCKSCMCCKACIDCISCEICEMCVECSRCKQCLRCSCCIDCERCLDCFNCSGLNKAQYCWENEQLSKEEYERRLKLKNEPEITKIKKLLESAIDQMKDVYDRYIGKGQHNSNS